MDLNLSDEQQQLVDAVGALYAKESSSERVRAAEATGHDAELWRRLLEVGAVDMAVDEAAGGWGATLLDLALVAEQHGRYLGSAPLIEAQAAARLLAAVGATEALAEARAADRLTTLALHPARRGVLPLVPAGAVADTAVYLDGDRLRAGTIRDRTPVRTVGSMPVADVAVGEDDPVVATGPEAVAAFERARDEWLALMANALVGLGNRALELGVAYAKERHAFGVPIGSFQAVAHGLANAATALDGAALLSREAAWAEAEEPERFAELAALSCAVATEAARQASERSLHYHGGYGFMLEYDVQLYFRRAKAWPAQFGEPAALFARGERARLGRG